jgi:hypothetical protein
MKIKRLLYRLWLSIIATNVINLSMILYSIKHRLNPLYDSSKHKSKEVSKKTQSLSKQIEKQYGIPIIPDSQLEQFRKEYTVKVAIIGDKAYWVHNNVFYETDVVDGEIDKTSSKPIDADTLSTKQVRMLMDVLDSIS